MPVYCHWCIFLTLQKKKQPPSRFQIHQGTLLDVADRKQRAQIQGDMKSPALTGVSGKQQYQALSPYSEMCLGRRSSLPYMKCFSMFSEYLEAGGFLPIASATSRICMGAEPQQTPWYLTPC